MTISGSLLPKGSKKIILLPKELGNITEINIFELPSPSNNLTKPSIRLFKLGNDHHLYQLNTFTFSKGCAHKEKEYLINDSYHYTDDGKPIKSAFIINENDRSDGFILEDSDFEVSTRYDITFSLIGAYFKESKVNDELSYVEDKTVDTKIKTLTSDDRFSTLTDYHDLLIDNHDNGWSNISKDTLRFALGNISETIQEAGDEYYKIKEDLICKFVLGKIKKIVDNFPSSLPIPIDLPIEIKQHRKVVMACNILISLIPIEAYRRILTSSQELDGINVKESFEKYKLYEKENAAKVAERDILAQNAINVGLSDGMTKKPLKKIAKKVIPKKKVATGKGAIDGFFKKKI